MKPQDTLLGTGKIPKALTIAGSDSGGGAGIEADLKTFAALGVHGLAALTSITAQNTLRVESIQDVRPEMVKAQIESVGEDIGVDAAKTGMLHTPEIVRVVAEIIRKYGFATVVDPVMVAKSGANLLEPEAIEVLKSKLIPIARVVTPNVLEAEVLSGVKIVSYDDAVVAAREIAGLGAEAVVVKGGHIHGNRAIDILYVNGVTRKFEAERLSQNATHGTGCSFSAAIAAEMAKGREIIEAVATAKEIVTEAIRYGLKIGKGHGPVNPLAGLYKEAEKYSVIRNVSEALGILERDPNLHLLIPESQTNLAMATSYAIDLDDLVAIPGRIVRVGKRVLATAPPEFGASKHVAATVLAAKKYDSQIRAAMNIRFSKEILEICQRMKLTVSFYDRKLEPAEVKLTEGKTTSWGAEQALKRIGRVPDVIFHEGDWGKEPMIVILATNAVELVKSVQKIAAEYSK